jgi:hypothetical protein
MQRALLQRVSPMNFIPSMCLQIRRDNLTKHLLSSARQGHATVVCRVAIVSIQAEGNLKHWRDKTLIEQHGSTSTAPDGTCIKAPTVVQ